MRITTSTISRDEAATEPTPESPWLCMSRGGTYHIVLFSSLTHGIVLDPGRSEYATGHCAEDWTPANQRKDWRRLGSGSQVTIAVV